MVIKRNIKDVMQVNKKMRLNSYLCYDKLKIYGRQLLRKEIRRSVQFKKG